VAYKLSERLNQNKETPSFEDGVDLEKVVIVFIVFGILSLITAWIFSMETQRLFSDTVRTYVSPSVPSQQAVAGEQEEGKGVATIGPITVQRYKEVYEISIASSVPENTWSFVEGEVLDAEKDYLFSFGKELWSETGYDDEGAWRESDNSYSMKLTFPQPGQYYLNLKSSGSYNPDAVQVTISKKRGSSIPHFVFGIFTLLIGLVLSEVHKKTLTKMARRMSND
jgi:hypothetical protein